MRDPWISAAVRELQVALDASALSWTDQGSCAEVDGDLWFPGRGGSVREPKAICRKCPVRAECLEYALENDERFGIYGGLSPRERRDLKRQREEAAA